MSALNVVFQELVDLLGLLVASLDKPVRVTWINDTKLTVSQQCQVEFCFEGSCWESVACHILPMFVGHIFLGRPWLYDHRVINDGFTNTYTL